MGKVHATQLTEVSEITNAVRRIHEDASIVQEARRSLSGALDLLGLRGTPREAVRPLLMAATSGGTSGNVVEPSFFWAS